jgi:hypothetical protein
MFQTNVGTTDRIIRVAVGLLLLLAFFLHEAAGEWRWLYLLGLIPLASGLLRTCPVYSLLGKSTCPR